MNKAELFAGSNTVTVQPGANRITEITLKRRVAGVMAYLRIFHPTLQKYSSYYTKTNIRTCR